MKTTNIELIVKYKYRETPVNKELEIYKTGNINNLIENLFTGNVGVEYVIFACRKYYFNGGKLDNMEYIYA